MKLGASFAAAGLLTLLVSNADAALTSSEKGQIKDYVAAAKIENAAGVRSMIARTDHTPEESAEALTEAVAPVSWTDGRGAFLKEMVFGNGSAASRPVLAVDTVKAVLGRADAIYQHEGASLEKNGRGHGELVALYGFLDSTIANAGNPTAASHDGLAGISPATYDECSKVIKDHIEKNAKYLKGADAIPEPMARIRAQAQSLVIDMMPDGLTRRVEAADRLGLKGARKTMLTEWGVLFQDAGKMDDAHVEKLRQTLLRMSGARSDLSLVYYGPTDHRQGLRARGEVAHVVGGNDSWTLGGDAPATFDPALATITHDLAVIEARHALKASAALTTQVGADAVATAGDPGRVLGKPRAPSAEYILGAAIASLLIDAPRSFDLAVARFNGNQPQTAALVSDALAAIAMYGENGKADLAKAGAWATATGFKKGTGDVTTQVSFDGHVWSFDRQGATNAVVGVRKDGAAASAPKNLTASAPAPATKK
jgi:hypothetical protein